MSPEALALHRKRCAARARLYRRRLSLDARRRVLAQARALGAVPPGFDEAGFLAGRGPKHDAPEVDAAKDDADHEPFLALHPQRTTEAPRDPAGYAFWVARRVAEVERALEGEQIDMMDALMPKLATLFPAESLIAGPFRSLVYYRDGHTIARDSMGLLRYPNGQLLVTGTGQLRYPSGRVACDPASRSWAYPNGRPLKDANGRWFLPTGQNCTLDYLVGQVSKAAGALGPPLQLGLRRLLDREMALFELALLEVAWWFLQP